MTKSIETVDVDSDNEIRALYTRMMMNEIWVPTRIEMVVVLIRSLRQRR